jgi:hypothetical protein
MSLTHKQCEANEYNHCSGNTTEEQVIFKYRDSEGRTQEDTVLSVTLCQTHARWLYEINEGNPLEMRGDEETSALHDDLFKYFADTVSMYTLLTYKTCVDGVTTDKYVLLQGRDIDHFLLLLEKEDNSISMIDEIGVFQPLLHLSEHEGITIYTETMFEIKNIQSETALLLLSTGQIDLYCSVELYHFVSRRYFQVEYNPTLDMEYTLKPVPEAICRHFTLRFGEAIG